MSSDDTRVVEFRSRRPLAEVEAEREEIEQRNKQASVEEVVEALNQLSKHASEETLTDFIVIARNPQTGHFYTDVFFDRVQDREKAFAMVGVLENLKLEMADISALAPAFMIDGSVVDPMMVPEIDPEEDYE